MQTKLTAFEQHLSRYYHKDSVCEFAVRTMIETTNEFISFFPDLGPAIAEKERLDLVCHYFKYLGRYDDFCYLIMSWVIYGETRNDHLLWSMGIPKGDR
jgi:hypothetical protein